MTNTPKKELTDKLDMNSINIASVSGGRESTAMVIAMEKKYGKDFFDKKIFADTGRDPVGRATVDFLNVRGWKTTIVKSKYGDIQDYYTDIDVDKEDIQGHALPMRAQKACSYKFKIMPIINYLRDKYGKKQHFNIYYGFTIAKKDVKRKERMISKKYKRNYATYNFPLIDIFRWDRQHCTELCMKEFGFVPDKSACDLCFENTIGDWRKLYKDNPKRALEIMKWEQGSHTYKKYGYGLNAVPLDILFKQRSSQKEGQQNLFSDEVIDKTAKTEEMLKEIDPGCACMGDNGVFVDEHEIESLIGESLQDVGFVVVKDW